MVALAAPVLPRGAIPPRPMAGLGFELHVFTWLFVGGASSLGWVGKVMGAVIGTFIVDVMNNGKSFPGVGIDYQRAIEGLVLLATVSSMSTTRTSRNRWSLR